jgi:hypothetical protein
MTRGNSEIGFETPSRGDKKFIKAPLNITRERLSPTE